MEIRTVYFKTYSNVKCEGQIIIKVNVTQSSQTAMLPQIRKEEGATEGLELAPILSDDETAAVLLAGQSVPNGQCSTGTMWFALKRTSPGVFSSTWQAGITNHTTRLTYDNWNDNEPNNSVTG